MNIIAFTVRVLGYAAVAALAFASLPASATSGCYDGYGADCVAATSRGLSNSIQSATTVQQALIISTVLGSVGNRSAGLGPRASLDGQTGLAAATPGSRWNAWLSGAENRVAYEFVPLRSMGTVHNLVGGADYRWDDKLTVGLSLGLDRTDIATGFNRGSLKGDGWSLAPYASYQIDQTWSVDGMLGFGENRLRSVDVTAGNVVGDSKSDRRFGAVNLSWTRWYGATQVIAKGSYIDSEDATGQFRQSNNVTVAAVTNHLSQLRASVQVGFWQPGGWMPWLGWQYVMDVTAPTQTNPTGATPPPGNERTGFVFSAGADIYSKGPVSGGFMVSTDFLREDRRQTTVMGNLLFRF